MTVTIQTKWTQELFDEAMITFERSLNRTIHINCSHDTKTMLETIAYWATNRGHSVITIDEDRMIVTVKKKAKKTVGGYQPVVNTAKPLSPPTSGSNAVKPRYRLGSGCKNCGRSHCCVKATHIENYSLKCDCSDFVFEDTHWSCF